MQVENFSRRPTNELLELVQYALRRFPFGAKRLIVKDSTSKDLTDEDKKKLKPGHGAEGLCRRTPQGLVVYIWLSDDSVEFPHFDGFLIKSQPQLSNGAFVETWQEEFVLVLVHELAHADQFARGFDINNNRLAAEIEAETEARESLAAFRNTALLDGKRVITLKLSATKTKRALQSFKKVVDGALTSKTKLVA